MPSPNDIQSNPVNADTEGAIESVGIIEGVRTKLNLEKMYGIYPGKDKEHGP